MQSTKIVTMLLAATVLSAMCHAWSQPSVAGDSPSGELPTSSNAVKSNISMPHRAALVVSEAV